MASPAPTTTRLMTNVNNLDAIVQTPPQPPEPPDVTDEPKRRGWLRRWWWVVAIVTVTSVIATVTVASMIIQVDYVIESPGNLYATNERITIDGAPRYETADKIDLVTVSLDTRVSHFEKFLADHNGDDVVI